MREGLPSVTASVVAAIRALYHEMPEPYRLAPDPLAAALVPGPLALPARALSRAPWAAPAVHHALGVATLGLNYHVALRTRAIDDALREALALGTAQVVVLGAGLDSRALRMDELAAARVFEVDYPSTQRYKIRRLAAMPGGAEPKARELVHVAVDFERDRLVKALPAAGFRAEERSFWILEGVTMYLTPEAIADTLGAVALLSAPQSRIAVTYGMGPGDRLITALATIFRGAFHLMGEPLKSPLLAEDMDAILKRAGLRRIADGSTVDWGARYWPGFRGVRPIERLAVAEMPASPVE